MQTTEMHVPGGSRDPKSKSKMSSGRLLLRPFLGVQMLAFVFPYLFLVRQSLCLNPHLFLKTSFYLWHFTKHASLHIQPNPRGVEVKS